MFLVLLTGLHSLTKEYVQKKRKILIVGGKKALIMTPKQKAKKNKDNAGATIDRAWLQ